MAQKETNDPSSSILLANTADILENYTSEDLEAAILTLRKAKVRAQQREKEERRRQEEEARRQEQEAHIQKVTCMDLPLDWRNAFDSDLRTQGVHTDNISDALILCLNALGRVDIEYIASVTGADYKTVISSLKGTIYQNPETWNECFYQGWETAEEYLSGNLVRKWKTAQNANAQYDGYFAENVAAIEKVLPPAIAAEDIYITLGSPWVPTDVIDDFIRDILGRPSGIQPEPTLHDEWTGTWEIPNKSRYHHSISVRETYGTSRMEALYILERTLNMKTVAVADEIDCPTSSSGKKRVINEAETAAVLEKQQRLIQEFQKWVWTDADRRKRLEEIFENKYGRVRRRVFDGSFLTFPGLSPAISLYPYQKDAVARILFTPNTLLAHDVGSGKTYIMIAAGQELRRMGLSQKNLYVVPNHIIGQWKSIFLRMYPTASLLCVDPKSFVPSKREQVLRQIRDNNYDGIIMAYSCFAQIPLSRDYYAAELKEKKEAVSALVCQKSKATTKLKKKQRELDQKLSEMLVALEETYDTIYFDELGITRLFVDEAHHFKNVPLETNINSVLGINPRGSQKCQDMLDKVRSVQKKNGGKGVVMATGTPITNSITDVYILQQYLQSGELALLDLQSFDSWIGMFAEKTTAFEIDVDTSTYRLATRFSRFHNLPELTALLASIADFHQIEPGTGIPRFDGYQDAVIAKTPALIAYLQEISSRADDVRRGRVHRREDNMLKITTDGRKAALDIRLVNPASSFSYQSKVARCTENVTDIYFRTMPQKSTQIIFCDISTPKAGFNLYSELKDRLIHQGIPAVEIAFIHDAKNETQRSCLFARVRCGEIRVLIGSTFKLGLGVNIQDRLIALHHLDVPWRPADMTQREGRILRQGNTNPQVYIFRYITEGSFDAYSWQLLETKQRFISDLLAGSLSERSASDIEDTVLTYAEVKALAIGNPLIKQRVEAANELSRLLTLQRKRNESRMRLEQELLALPQRITHQKLLIRHFNEDLAYYQSWVAPKEDPQQRRELRQRLSTALHDHTLEPKERDLMPYRGFRIVLPANMTLQKPYIWLVRRGKYYVELGDTEIGNLIRIDHFLDHFHELQKTYRQTLVTLQEREAAIRNELSTPECYQESIEYYQHTLETLDQKLGVNSK